MDLKELIDSLVSLQKRYKPIKYLFGVLALVIIVEILDIFNLLSIKPLVAGGFLFIFYILFIVTTNLTENKNSNWVKFFGIIVALVSVSAFILFVSIVFFDTPKNFKEFFNDENKSKNEVSIDRESSNDWESKFDIYGMDEESCNFPIMFSDSVFSHEIKGDTVLLPIKLVLDTLSPKIKAPIFVRKSWGFSFPFAITGKSKKVSTLTNRMRVKIFAENKIFAHSNAESTCGGDMYYHESKDIVGLNTNTKYYEKIVTFPKADFYTISENEVVGFELNFKIEKLGIYRIEIDIPYTNNGKKGLATIKLPIYVAPNKFDVWESLYRSDLDTTKFKYLKSRSNTWNGYEYKTKFTKSNSL